MATASTLPHFNFYYSPPDRRPEESFITGTGMIEPKTFTERKLSAVYAAQRERALQAGMLAIDYDSLRDAHISCAEMLDANDRLDQAILPFDKRYPLLLEATRPEHGVGATVELHFREKGSAPIDYRLHWNRSEESAINTQKLIPKHAPPPLPESKSAEDVLLEILRERYPDELVIVPDSVVAFSRMLDVLRKEMECQVFYNSEVHQIQLHYRRGEYTVTWILSFYAALRLNEVILRGDHSQLEDS